MKILVIANDINIPPVRYGGAERIVHNLSSVLEKNHYEINLLAGKGSRKYGGKTLNYKIYRFGTSFLGRIINWAEFQTQTIRLSRDIDMIHSFIFWPEIHYFLNKLNKPIIFRQGNTPSKNDFKRIIKSKPHKGYLQCISKNQLNKIDINDSTKTFVTHNCVDTKKFKNIEGSQRKYLAYLGRLNYNKGVDIAIKLAIDSGLNLKIAGPVRKSEPNADKLFNEKVKPFLGEAIQYVGELNDLEKISFLSNAIALIAPNRWDEPFGITNIEALACGVPIIATNKGSLTEIVKDKETGFLCDNYLELLNSINDISYISNKKCRKDACERFSIEKYWQNTQKIYNQILL